MRAQSEYDYGFVDKAKSNESVQNNGSERMTAIQDS